MPWEVHRADSRAVTSTDWLHSAHSFAFGPHYDPENVSFGSLLAFNVDEVQPGEGYVRHRHAGVEILTWVLAGVLEHVDASGNRLVRPGTLQYLSAGSGIEHAERSASRVEPVRVVQMWLMPDRPDGAPHYRTADLSRGRGSAGEGGLVLAASGSRAAPVRIRQPGAELFVGRLPAGRELPLPVAPYVHLFVTSGEASIGDAVRLSAEDALRVIGEQPLRLTADSDVELLVWAMASSLH